MWYTYAIWYMYDSENVYFKTCYMILIYIYVHLATVYDLQHI